MQLLKWHHKVICRSQRLRDRRCIQENLDHPGDAEQDAGPDQCRKFRPPQQLDDNQQQNAEGSATQDQVYETGKGQFN